MDQQPQTETSEASTSQSSERFVLHYNEQYPLPQQRVESDGSGFGSSDITESDHRSSTVPSYPLPQQRVQSDGSGLGSDLDSDSISTEEVPNIYSTLHMEVPNGTWA